MLDLSTIPHSPGCYLMHDVDDTIIYVGKAKDLYNRVKSYFTGSHNAKTTKMVSLIDHFEYIITSSETEAFILEMNLIKKHMPKYNIMLTDDKSYPYICVTNEKNPRLLYSREVNKRLGKYYGPYPNARAAKETVELLNRMYPLRKCYKIPKKACLYYHIGACLAPCINNVNHQEYEEIKTKINDVLKGNIKTEIQQLTKLMEESSNVLQFEKAKEYRDLIIDLKTVAEKQKMAGYNESVDAFGYYYNDEYVSIQVFHLREGKVLERKGYLFNNNKNPLEIFEEFIGQFYLVQNNPLPRTILISEGNAEALESGLSHKILVPKKGKNKELVNLVCDNAKNKIDVLIKRKDIEFQKTDGAIIELSKLLHLEKLEVIEIFDNSNIMGASPVSAMVCFVNGKPNRKLYRKFKIKTVVGANEAATMFEVVSRRYKDLNNKPDLIIMDGGQIQVNSAKKALMEVNRNIPVLGLIKDDNHKTNSVLYNDQIIAVPKNSYVFRLLEAMQDEVHRYAIAYFRTTHGKNTITSRLTSIKGIGEVKKNKILRALESNDFENELKRLSLTDEQIKAVLELIKKV